MQFEFISLILTYSLGDLGEARGEGSSSPLEEGRVGTRVLDAELNCTYGVEDRASGRSESVADHGEQHLLRGD